MPFVFPSAGSAAYAAMDLGEALKLIQLLAWGIAIPQRNLHPAGLLLQPVQAPLAPCLL